jgi:hypothetical protein
MDNTKRANKMAFPFREILDGSTFTTHPIKRDGRVEVMMRTRNGFYRKQDSDREFEIDPSTMVTLLASPGVSRTLFVPENCEIKVWMSFNKEEKK